MTAPAIEHRIVGSDGESARKRLNGFAELSRPRLCNAECDDALHVARIGVECRARAGDRARVGLGAILHAGR